MPVQTRNPMRTAGSNRGLRPTLAENVARATVQMALEDQGKALNDLHEYIDAFEERLRPVLSQVPGKDQERGDTVEPTSIVERVEDRTRGIRSAYHKLVSMGERLEI